MLKSCKSFSSSFRKTFAPVVELTMYELIYELRHQTLIFHGLESVTT